MMRSRHILIYSSAGCIQFRDIGVQYAATTMVSTGPHNRQVNLQAAQSWLSKCSHVALWGEWGSPLTTLDQPFEYCLSILFVLCYEQVSFIKGHWFSLADSHSLFTTASHKSGVWWNMLPLLQRVQFQPESRSSKPLKTRLLSISTALFFLRSRKAEIMRFSYLPACVFLPIQLYLSIYAR